MTTTPATQALLPVTPEATIEFLNHAFRNIDIPELFPADLADIASGLERFARYRQAHPLPGDVGMLEKALRDVNDRVAVYGSEALGRTINDIVTAALTPSALSGDAGATGPWLKVGTFDPEPDALYLVQGTLRTSVKRGSDIDADNVAAALIAALPSHQGAD